MSAWKSGVCLPTRTPHDEELVVVLTSRGVVRSADEVGLGEASDGCATVDAPFVLPEDDCAVVLLGAAVFPDVEAGSGPELLAAVSALVGALLA